MKNHYFDGCNGGICLNCDLCRDPSCCPQTEECHGHNWDFLNRTPEEWLEAYPWIKERQQDV